MKKILIIAGPNGAGKTTFAKEFLPNEAACMEFVNADLIAAGLSPFQPDQVALTSARLMLQRIDKLVANGKNFAFETTLSTRCYLRLIPQWQAAGYTVKLSFLSLPDADFAIRRVHHRVLNGGHDIQVATIRRRYARGLKNLRDRYIGMVDEWSIYDASLNPPELLESGTNRPPENFMEEPHDYRSSIDRTRTTETPGDPDTSGAEAALKRAAAKAVARARAMGLEPVIRQATDIDQDILSVSADRRDRDHS